MNCLNGYFVAPNFDSLPEALLKAEGRGAMAAFSPSGLSVDGPAHQYHRAVMAELASGQHERLGDAILAAQTDLRRDRPHARAARRLPPPRRPRHETAVKDRNEPPARRHPAFLPTPDRKEDSSEKAGGWHLWFQRVSEWSAFCNSERARRSDGMLKPRSETLKAPDAAPGFSREGTPDTPLRHVLFPRHRASCRRGHLRHGVRGRELRRRCRPRTTRAPPAVGRQGARSSCTTAPVPS